MVLESDIAQLHRCRQLPTLPEVAMDGPLDCITTNIVECSHDFRPQMIGWHNLIMTVTDSTAQPQ